MKKTITTASGPRMVLRIIAECHQIDAGLAEIYLNVRALTDEEKKVLGVLFPRTGQLIDKALTTEAVLDCIVED